MMIYLGWPLIIIGTYFTIMGVVGLFRFPGFYNKLHAASVIECVGIPIALIGLAMLQSDLASAFKLVLIAVLIFILIPASTHAIGRASLLYKVDKQGRIK